MSDFLKFLFGNRAVEYKITPQRHKFAGDAASYISRTVGSDVVARLNQQVNSIQEAARQPVLLNVS
ncbi:hypothetical protein [Mastigocladopsis repens]|uniref:hypothetical protein n=1 Tax=Mastigocladopsis repens TaxID=221287 RepID=UPI00030BE7F8|nr:hypothetical protein [Mastigocladopsis repens]